MSAYVLPLESTRDADASRVGAKAARLGTLLDAGFPVPPGVCVTTDAFQGAIATRWPAIDAISGQAESRTLAGGAEAARRIAASLADLQVPAEVMDAVRDALPAIAAPGDALAVRSSATIEDGAEVSFAGAFQTVLGGRGEAALQNAILACWRSLLGVNTLAAHAIHGKSLQNVALAVLIQPVVEAQCAGVCFSVDPVHHRQDRMLINAAWGLGAGVVEGSVATPTASQQNERINGLAAGPGRYRGRARVVAANVDLPELSPGDVLVAENVGPRWTPLLPILGGMVLDGGSLGQHAAATAREYGVPAVIETKNGTRRIPDGAWVSVDGTRAASRWN
jgi:phosphoenolpyruvate synthase/pyruvate phosphate dikinase